jgi:hypothetical protein
MNLKTVISLLVVYAILGGILAAYEVMLIVR